MQRPMEQLIHTLMLANELLPPLQVASLPLCMVASLGALEAMLTFVVAADG